MSEGSQKEEGDGWRHRFKSDLCLLVKEFLKNRGYSDPSDQNNYKDDLSNVADSLNDATSYSLSEERHVIQKNELYRQSKLEVLLAQLVKPFLQDNKIGNNLSIFAEQLTGRIMKRLPEIDCLFDERLSNLRPFQGFSYQMLLPWYLSSNWSNTFSLISASRFQHLKTITAHRLPAYCVIFDRSDNRIITGGDDGVVKIWCSHTGHLLYSLRSHSNCISDITLDPSNTVLAVGAMDGYITFWDLSLGQYLFTINAFSPVLTLEFRPQDGRSKDLILLCTCSDGYAKFWSINLQQHSFSPSPIKYHCKSLAQDEIRCASFSPGGTRFVTGATDGVVRLFAVPELSVIKSGIQPTIQCPQYINLDDHEGYVNSVHFSTKGTEFATSSWDGSVRRWTYDDVNKKTWSSTLFATETVLGPSKDTLLPGRPRKVTIVTYCNRDCNIMAAVNQDHELILFDVKQRRKPKVFKYHIGEVFILTTHPVDDRIVLSAGCDGKAALWDVEAGKQIFAYAAENCRFLDGNFSQSGNMFALVDDIGRFSLFGCGYSIDSYAMAAPSQFFPTEWNDLIFDSNRNAIDSSTQRPPHSSPRNVVVTIEGNRVKESVMTESYALSIPIEGDSFILSRQHQLYRKQSHTETRLFALEMQNTPPGTMPRQTRSRRRKIIFGSDIDEEDLPSLNAAQLLGNAILNESDDELFLPAPPVETDRSLTITSGDEGESAFSPYNFRRREANRQNHQPVTSTPPPQPPRRLTARQASLLQNSNPTTPSVIEDQRQNAASSTSAVPRRRPLIADSSSSETEEIIRPPKRRAAPLAEQSTVAASSAPKAVSPWLKTVDRQLFPYLPQMYDVVAYFPEGHELFISKVKEPQFFEHFPWDVYPDLEPVVFGQIVKLSFKVGPPTWCSLELRLLDRQKVKETLPPFTIGSSSRIIKISYYDLENQPDFIIPYCRYAWSVQPAQLFDQDEIVRAVFEKDESYEAKIKKVKLPKCEIAQNPWQCYLVKWLSVDGPPESLSPWELETIFEDEFPNRTPHECNEYIENEILDVLTDGIKEMLSDPRFTAFRKPVDIRTFTDYLSYVAYPMDLSTIQRRLVNGYYRRLEAVEWDLRLVCENAAAYNLPDSEIMDGAKYLFKEALMLIKRADRAGRRVSRGSLTILSTPNSSSQRQQITPPRVSGREERALRRARLFSDPPSEEHDHFVTPNERNTRRTPLNVTEYSSSSRSDRTRHQDIPSDDFMEDSMRRRPTRASAQRASTAIHNAFNQGANF